MCCGRISPSGEVCHFDGWNLANHVCRCPNRTHIVKQRRCFNCEIPEIKFLCHNCRIGHSVLSISPICVRLRTSLHEMAYRILVLSWADNLMLASGSTKLRLGGTDGAAFASKCRRSGSRFCCHDVIAQLLLQRKPESLDISWPR